MSSYGPDSPRPTDAELEILTVLWSVGPATVREVHDVIIRMTEKGLLLRDEKERAHVYRPAKPRDCTRLQLAGDLLERAFNGSASQLLIGTLSARRASAKELIELRRLLDEHQGNRR